MLPLKNIEIAEQLCELGLGSVRNGPGVIPPALGGIGGPNRGRSGVKAEVLHERGGIRLQLVLSRSL
jgi:hypothetical protein